MLDTGDAIFGFAVAAAIAWLLVPVADWLAWRWGIVDQPGDRRIHLSPRPKLGGLAMLVAVVAAGVIALPADPETRAILTGAVVIAIVGMADDALELSAPVKLAGQIIAVAIPVGAGVSVTDFTIPFFGRLEPGGVELVSLPWLGMVDLGELLTVLGIVAVVNAVNFADGVDGLAAGVVVISALSLTAIALSLDRNAAGVLAAITAGAALGFLRHGFPPASSFMGDTGSNLLGYLLGAIAVQGALKTNAVVAVAFPLAVLTVPLLDTGFVIAKRLKHRRPVFQADTSHFHHRMAGIGFSQRRTLAYLYGWTLAMAAFALALRFVPYSDDAGNLDLEWSLVLGAFLLTAVAASVYLLVSLEILKLRRLRSVQVADAGVPISLDQVDEGVERELTTGSFAARVPETGEFEVIDPETGTWGPGK